MPSMWRDKDSGIYYANFRIPTDLLQHYKRSHINKSLRTKNEKEAERKNCEKWLEYLREFDRIRRERALAGSLTEEAIPHLLDEWLHSTLREDEQQRLVGIIPRVAEDENPGYSEVIDQLIEGASSGKHPDFLIREIAWLLDQKGITYDSRSFAFLKLIEDFSPIFGRYIRALCSRDQGDRVPTPAAPAPTQVAIPLSRLISAYVANRSKGKAVALRKSHACLPKLLEIVGDKSIQSLKQQDLMDFFDVVQFLPSQRGGKKKPEGMTLRQWAGAEVTMAPATFTNNYLAPVTKFLAWAKGAYHDQGFPLGLNTDIVQYRGTRVEGEDKQRSFRTEELERLFLGDEMKTFAADPEKAGRYWLPLLGLHTGARINELCQINPSVDWIEQEGVQCLKITTETESGEDVTKSIKTGTARTVPIHPKLIELGFLVYLERVKACGAGRLFPEFKPKSGRAGERAREWFSSFVVDAGLRDDTPFAKITGFHAFRHTLITYAANHEDVAMEVDIDLITGHVGRGSSSKRGYISKREVRRAYKTLCKVDFGLAFAKPI